MNDPVLTVDIGATKIAAGLVYPDGSVDYLKEIPTEAQKGGESLMVKVIELCRAFLGELRQEKKGASSAGITPIYIGVSTAGQIDDSTGKVIFATENLPGWTGIDIKGRVESALGIQTYVENDVNCLALGEANFGAGKGSRHILFLAVGTGIGGAIIIDGKLYRGWKGSAGELGHITIDYQGNLCNCGARGCIETYASGPVIEKSYNQGRKGKRLTCREITALAQGGDEYALNVIRSAGKYLGICLFGLLNLLNPEMVIIGGGVLNTNDIYIDAVRKAVAQNALGPLKDTPIIKTQLKGNIANLVGAAVVCRQQIK